MTRFDEEQKHIHYLDLDMENFSSVPKVLFFLLFSPYYFRDRCFKPNSVFH